MKKYRNYILLVAITLTSCATQKHHEQQSTHNETRQVQVSATADSIQWNGRVGKWSFDVKAGRYELRLDSSMQQQKKTTDSLVTNRRSFSTYVWWAFGIILVLVALLLSIKRWL